ncbi:uncharacterized protein H6S33_006875, partial [Morchella sextelata]|uniref:uncharacterized protein n=1 Tax=Morchella sextelata TaxID=1174677 RepID=UPI001D03DF62
MTFSLLNLPKVYTSIYNGLKVEIQNWLILDVDMKDKLSRGQGDCQFKKPSGDSDDNDDGVTIVDPDALSIFFILVPQPTYDWNDPLNEPPFIGIWTKKTFPELCNLILKYNAPGKAVRTMWEAIGNIPPVAVPPVQPVEVPITDSEKLDGWFKNSSARPWRILAVLYRA